VEVLLDGLQIPALLHGGYGGALVGGIGAVANLGSNIINAATGGTQTSGGTPTNTGTIANGNGYPGTFGKGR